jgi:predicted alpha/beta hydrolase family esterase
VRDIIILPGIGGSGKTHWQSTWQQCDPRMRRFEPRDWEAPELADWIEALDRAVAAAASPPVLVAHSLACLLVPHWAARTGRAVAGALLVAVPDPASPAFPAEAASFADPPRSRLPFPSLVIASSDDPYGSEAYVRRTAAAWGSRFVVAGALGHINAASGLGDWSQGREMLEAFLRRLGAGLEGIAGDAMDGLRAGG